MSIIYSHFITIPGFRVKYLQSNNFNQIPAIMVIQYISSVFDNIIKNAVIVFF